MLNAPVDEVVARLRAAGCVFAEDEARILLADDPDEAALEARLRRREAGEPLEVIVGWAEFRGLRVNVAPGVFVPRQRTGLLVEVALAATALADRATDAAVLDLCCGAGAVAAAIEAARPRARVLAADLDERATADARTNVRDAGHVFTGDLFDALPPEWRGRLDVVVANAPYVPTGEIAFMPAEAREHEPNHALDGGPTGTELQRRIAETAPEWLRSEGVLAIETSERQSATTVAHLEANGFAARVVRDDDLDATVVTGALRRR
nr:putative protein N(5)-glutamine methyltransferase [Frondihabitans australicus]